MEKVNVMIKLVKTVGGQDGAPGKCWKCNSIHFQKIGMAWNCTECGTYIPTSFTDLRKNLQKLQVLHGNLRTMIDGLERLVQHQKENK